MALYCILTDSSVSAHDDAGCKFNKGIPVVIHVLANSIENMSAEFNMLQGASACYLFTKCYDLQSIHPGMGISITDVYSRLHKGICHNAI